MARYSGEGTPVGSFGGAATCSGLFVGVHALYEGGREPRFGRSLSLPPFDALSLAQGRPLSDPVCLGAVLLNFVTFSSGLNPIEPPV
jgi:hypothetical protein